jgi:hypothetical protein
MDNFNFRHFSMQFCFMTAIHAFPSSRLPFPLRRQCRTWKFPSEQEKIPWRICDRFFMHVMTFSRCRRLDVHRKTRYPSSSYPVANVRPLTTVSWRADWCILGPTKKIGTNFLACSFSFFYTAILSEGCPLCYVESAGWHIVLSTSDDVVLSISWADSPRQP